MFLEKFWKNSRTLFLDENKHYQKFCKLYSKEGILYADFGYYNNKKYGLTKELHSKKHFWLSINKNNVYHGVQFRMILTS